MKVGDAVVLYDWTSGERKTTNVVGVVLSIDTWCDPGAPDRNFGCTVEVLWPKSNKWPTGIERHEHDELNVVSYCS